jgi:TRIAP1/MDM35 family protein
MKLTMIVEYLRGTADTDECASLFKTYNTCLFKALKAKGIDSMVEEARKEAQETDAEHMARPVR